MQYTALTHSDSAGGTGNRGNLPWRQFSLFHRNRVRHSYPFECSILNKSGPVSFFLGNTAGVVVARRFAQSCRTTLRRDLLMWIPPLYWNFLAASPCAKTAASFSNLATFLPSPAESRNSFTSNAALLALAFRADCGEALTERRRTAEGAIPPNTSDPPSCRLFNIAQPQLLAESKMQPPL